MMSKKHHSVFQYSTFIEKYTSIFYEKKGSQKEKWVSEVSVLFWPSFEVPHPPKHNMNPTLNTANLCFICTRNLFQTDSTILAD